MAPHCLPHKWCFYGDTCRIRTHHPCVMSPHPKPLHYTTAHHPPTLPKIIIIMNDPRCTSYRKPSHFSRDFPEAYSRSEASLACDFPWLCCYQKIAKGGIWSIFAPKAFPVDSCFLFGLHLNATFYHSKWFARHFKCPSPRHIS